MNRDALILILLLVLVGAGAALFHFVTDKEAALEPQPGTPFEARERDEVASGRRPARQGGETAVADLGAPRPAAPKGAELPPVTSRDDFGALQGAVVVRVRDAEAEPLQDAEVLLFEYFGAGGPGSARGAPLATGSTGEAGEWRSEALDVDRGYAIEVRHPQHRRFRSGALRLAPGEQLIQDVTMGAGLSLSGSVRMAGDAAAVADARVTVWDLSAVGGDPEGELEAEGLTDGEGRFLIERLAAGAKRVVASRDGLGSATLPFVVLGAGTTPRPIELVMSEGRAISGRVLEPDGRPIAGASVKARPCNGQEDAVVTGFYPEVLTDPEGRYTITGLLEGYYFLRAAKRGFAEGNFGRPGGERKVSMTNARAGDRDVDLCLGRGPRVRGRVIDGRTGEPVAVFDLCSDGRKDPIELDERLRQRVKDPDGRFDYAVPVLGSQSRYIWLHARAPGFAGGSALVDFSEGGQGRGPLVTEREGIEIVMIPGGGIGGRVVAAAGRPLAGVSVLARRLRDPATVPNAALDQSLFPESHVLAGRARSDAEGRYLVPNLGAGRYRIEFEHESFAPAVHPEEVVFAGEGEIDLGTSSLDEGGVVAGQVVAESGAAQEGARVELIAGDRRLGRSFSARTGLAGAFRFERVPAGEYRLVVTERDGLDTRSAWYQELKKRRPEEIPVRVEVGSERTFRLAR